MKLIFFSLVVLVLSPAISLACKNDGECQAGLACIDGVCAKRSNDFTRTPRGGTTFGIQSPQMRALDMKLSPEEYKSKRLQYQNNDDNKQ